MLSVYKLTTAINESATGMSSNVDAHVFHGSMDEMAAEFGFTLMSEAADMATMVVTAEEIMTEAAISNPSSLAAMSENVLDNIGSKLKGIIDKLIAMVKGVIDKLKAFFFKFTGKTAEWLKVMKPRITAAAGQAGASEFNVEAHSWDVDYITDGMVSGIDRLMAIAAKTDDKFKMVSDVTSTIDSLKTNMDPSMQGKGGDDPAVKSAVEKLEQYIDSAKEDEKEAADGMATVIADAMEVAESVSTLEEVWSAVTKKATGGEKVTVKIGEIKCGKFGSSYDGMLKAIEESKKTISAIQKSYDNHLKTLKTLRSKVDGVFKKDSKVDKLEKFPTDLKTKYNAAISSGSAIVTKTLSMTESAINNARAKNTSCLETMTSEYMGILSKFAGYKGKKEKD